MEFASDNGGPVHPAVLAALADANAGHAAAYGADALTETVRARLQALFGAPDAAVHLVTTGTAANALILATMAQPWQTVFCARHAHIEADECGAPEFFTAGARLTAVDGPGGKMDPDALRAAIAATGARGVHSIQRGPVSITQPTESGTLYTLEEIAAICAAAHDHGLPVHMDGARFANAAVRLDCTPAEMTWKAGVDAVVFGGTKNGLMGVEAVLLFDPAPAWAFELRRKRGAHLISKHRYLAAQMAAYLDGDLWRELAARANAAADRLAAGLRETAAAEIVHPVGANMVFARWPRALHRHLHASGAHYYLWDGALEGPDEAAPLTARLVCDWSTEPAAIDALLAQF